MLELHALGHGFGFTTQTRFFLGRIFTTHLHMREHADGVALDRIQQFLEQGEGLALVFLLGVLLRIAAQVNAVTQVIHGRQVVFPQVVEDTQENLLLEGAQGFSAGFGFFLVIGADQLFKNARTQGLFVQLVVIIKPLLNRQTQVETAVQRLFQAGDIPLLRQRLRRDVLATLMQLNLNSEIDLSRTEQDLVMIRGIIRMEIRFAGLENDRLLQRMIRHKFGIALQNI